MAEFKLPSGRVIETREPSYGEEVHAISIGLKDPEAFHYAKFAATIALTREEIEMLSREDGRALAAEMNRVWDGRPEEKEIPFGKSSRQRSQVQSR